jgi:hypothetical protein
MTTLLPLHMLSVNELLKGRESFSDRKIRIEAIAVLKQMIESWLEEFYPKMPIEERRQIAEAMDMTLIENRKQESMKSVFSINEVIRMSFIEMQFMKKVSLVACKKSTTLIHLFLPSAIPSPSQ